MVRQFRYTIKQMMTEFPAGSIEGSEIPLAAARREFKDETGYEAARWTEVGELYESISTNRAKGLVYLAEELTDTKQYDMASDGIEGIVFIKDEEVESQIASGDITDSKTIAAYFKVKQLLESR